MHRDTLDDYVTYILPWVEKKVSGEQLEQDARQAPHVRACVVPNTSDDLPDRDEACYLNSCISKLGCSVSDPVKNTSNLRCGWRA